MSDTDNRKSGFELDVVKLPPLPVTDSEKKDDDEKQLKPQEKTPPQEESTKADVVKNIPPTQKSRSPIVWIILVAMIIGVLVFFLLIPKNQLPLVKNENIPAQFNQSMVTFIESTEKMRSILQTIDNISNRINSKAKITTILEAVKSAEDYFPIYESNKKQFLKNVNEFQQELETGGDIALIAVEHFYQQRSVAKFRTALENFLEVQKKYLTYFYDNYEKIHKKQQPQIYTYEKYYLEYTRSIEQYDQATDNENKIINHILQEYPETKKLFLIREGTAIFTIK